MAICPFAVQRPVASHGTAMTRQLGNVLHVQEGDNSPYGRFANANNNASSHFWISKTGVIEQYVDTDLASWAQKAGNHTYTSTETEGFVTELLTDAQVVAYARLYAWLAHTHGYPFIEANAPGERGFGVHYMGGVAWGAHPCPGPSRAAQRPAILVKAQPTPTPQQLGDDMSYERTVKYPDGSLVVANFDGSIWCAGTPSYGSFLSLRPDETQDLVLSSIWAHRPVDDRDKTLGSIVSTFGKDGTTVHEWKFDADFLKNHTKAARRKRSAKK